MVEDLQTALLQEEEGVEEGDLLLSYHQEGEGEEEVGAYHLEEVGVVVEVAFLPLPFLEVAEVEEATLMLPSSEEGH